MVKRHNHLMIIVEAEISIIRWNILRQFIMIVPNDDVHWPPRQSQRPPSNPPSLEYLTSGNDCQFCKFLQHMSCHICAKIFINRELDIYSVLTFDSADCQLDQVDVLTVHGCLLASAEGWDGDRRYVRRGQSSAGNSRLHDIDADNGQEMGIDDHWSVARWECSISRHRFEIYNVWR